MPYILQHYLSILQDWEWIYIKPPKGVINTTLAIAYYFLTAPSMYNWKGEEVSNANTFSSGLFSSNSTLSGIGSAVKKSAKAYLFIAFWGINLMSNCNKMIANFVRLFDSAGFESAYLRRYTLDIKVINATMSDAIIL